VLKEIGWQVFETGYSAYKPLAIQKIAGNTIIIKGLQQAQPYFPNLDQ
jgi:hypothetical protein